MPSVICNFSILAGMMSSTRTQVGLDCFLISCTTIAMLTFLCPLYLGIQSQNVLASESLGLIR